MTGFRELVGAPDTPRWNAVLFGGKVLIISRSIVNHSIEQSTVDFVNVYKNQNQYNNVE